MKYYGVGFEFVLHEMSYENLLLYSSTIPDYSAGKDDKKKHDEGVIKADDPKNKDLVKAIINGYRF